MDPLVVDLSFLRPIHVAIYAVLFLVAGWIFRDARRRGSPYAAVWALATLVLAIVAVLAYLYTYRHDFPAGTADRESGE